MISADELADDVVALLNDIEDKIIEFEAVNPEDVPEFDFEEDSTTSVQVYGFAESEEPTDRGDMLRQVRVIKVLVNTALSELVTKRVCSRFMNQLKEAFREVELSGFEWIGNETDTIYDMDAMKAKTHFKSVFTATFQTFG